MVIILEMIKNGEIIIESLNPDDEDFLAKFYEQRNRGGPYNINPSKLYKPACIVFMDLVISLTFILTSLMYFWFEIDNTD